MEVSGPTGEKRKASALPGINDGESDSPIGARRPVKTRIVESLEDDEEDINDKDGSYNSDKKDTTNSPEVISSDEEERILIESGSSSSIDASTTSRVTRQSAASEKRRSGKTIRGPINSGELSGRSTRPAPKVRKPPIPEVVPKCLVDLELSYTRQQWMDMDVSELGARCLDHLAELDRQRRRCSNLSGDVAGSMKKGNMVVSEIVKAFIERLSLEGDVSALRVENHSLREKVSALQRKEAAQRKIIDDLTRMVASLQKDVWALKEGHGPYPAEPSSSLRIGANACRNHLKKGLIADGGRE